MSEAHGQRQYRAAGADMHAHSMHSWLLHGMLGAGLDQVTAYRHTGCH